MTTGVDHQTESKHEFNGMHVIFVGDIQEKWTEPVVSAEKIMKEAGVTEPAQFVLEALDHKGGSPVAEFNSTDSVDLNAKERKFFRVTPGGGGRS